MDDSDNRHYITDRVHPIFQRIVTDLLLTKPDDLVEYMITWLKENRAEFQPLQINKNLLQFNVEKDEAEEKKKQDRNK